MGPFTLEWYHLLALLAGGLAAGPAAQSTLSILFGWLKNRFFPPAPGPTQKDLLQTLLFRLESMEADRSRTAAAKEPGSLPAGG